MTTETATMTTAEIIADAHINAPHGRVRITHSVMEGQPPHIFEASIISVTGDTVQYTTDGVWSSLATRSAHTAWEQISAPAPAVETYPTNPYSDGPHDAAQVSRWYAPTGYAYTRAEVEQAASLALGTPAVALRRVGAWAHCSAAAL